MMNSTLQSYESSILRTILDSLHSAVVVIDQDLTVFRLNPAAELMFHVSDSRAYGQHISKLLIDEYKFIDRIEHCLNSQHPFQAYDEEVMIHIGETIILDYIAIPLYIVDESPYLLLEFRSQSRHRRIAHDKALLDQQDASRDLLRGLAHEIKNPLGGLRGAAQLLERQLDESDREFTSVIIHEADRLQNLVDRMLGPRTMPNMESLNIHRVLEHVRQLVCAENPWIKFSIDYDPSMPEIRADESMMTQVFLNLCRNAVSALPDNSEHGRIKFRTRPLRNHTIGNRNWNLVARVEVIDNGEGIPDDIIEKIFLPMVTGRADGTGLGLSLAQNFINEHGGLIECTSEPGETCFTVLLPMETYDE